MDASKSTINGIFNRNRIIEIPFFQRSYVWGEKQWERFLEDLKFVSIRNKPYFMGSIIQKQKETSASEIVGDWRILIDGQQRLTTFIIFFKVLSLKTNIADLEQTFRLPLHENQVALWHNRNDLEAFTRVMELKKLTKLTPFGKSDSITAVYNYFFEKIKVEHFNHLNILRNVLFVAIDLGHDEEEQQIFDTINSLGVDLTTAELLKNFLFKRGETEKFDKYWRGVFEKDTETRDYWDKKQTVGRGTRHFIDLFFYAYLQVKIHDPKLEVTAAHKDDYSRVETLSESYKHFINNYITDRVSLLTDIKNYAEVFRAGINSEVISTALPADGAVERINALIFGLENSTIIPYVLFVLKNASESEQQKIFSFLEAYVLRRMVCRATTKNYNLLFGEKLISNNVVTLEALKEYVGDRADQVNYLPKDSDLETAFKSSKLTNKQASGILYFLESKIRAKTGKHSTALLGLKHYSLEHVMPKKWRTYWDKPKDEKLRDQKLLTLGNLAIIPSSLNSAIREGKWSTKRDGKSGKPGLSHYAAGLDTFQPYLSVSAWTEDIIDERADFLFKQACEAWPINLN